MVIFPQLSPGQQRNLLQDISNRLALINQMLTKKNRDTNLLRYLNLRSWEKTRQFLQCLLKELRGMTSEQSHACLQETYDVLIIFAKYWPLNQCIGHQLICPITKTFIREQTEAFYASNGYVYTVQGLQGLLQSKNYFPIVFPGSTVELCVHDIKAFRELPKKNNIALGVAKGFVVSGLCVFSMAAMLNPFGISLLGAVSGILVLAGMSVSLATMLSVGIIVAPVIAAMLYGGLTAWLEFKKEYPGQFHPSIRKGNKVETTPVSTVGCFSKLNITFEKYFYNNKKETHRSEQRKHSEKNTDEIPCLDDDQSLKYKL